VKTVALDRQELTLEHVLREAAGGEVVFLTEGGDARFALVAVDEADREVFALGSNPEFMTYLDACRERAKAGPRKSLREIRESYGVQPNPTEGAR
jgi:antitoxin (DNA-binding transcriptional repressor) of toxin-antitoxin stability system